MACPESYVRLPERIRKGHVYPIMSYIYIYYNIYIYMYVCIIPLNSSYIPVFLAFPQWFPVHSPRVLRAAHRRELNASRIDLEREVHGDSTRKQWKDPPFSMGKPTISMGYSINSYVKLPEGNWCYITGVISWLITGWWFQTCVIPYIGNNHPKWLIIS